MRTGTLANRMTREGEICGSKPNVVVYKFITKITKMPEN